MHASQCLVRPHNSRKNKMTSPREKSILPNSPPSLPQGPTVPLMQSHLLVVVNFNVLNNQYIAPITNSGGTFCSRLLVFFLKKKNHHASAARRQQPKVPTYVLLTSPYCIITTSPCVHPHNSSQRMFLYRKMGLYRPFFLVFSPNSPFTTTSLLHLQNTNTNCTQRNHP